MSTDPNAGSNNPFAGRAVKHEAVITLREYEGLPGVIDMDLKTTPTADELKNLFDSVAGKNVKDVADFIPTSILLALAAIEEVRSMMAGRVGETIPPELMPKTN